MPTSPADDGPTRSPALTWMMLAVILLLLLGVGARGLLRSGEQDAAGQETTERTEFTTTMDPQTETPGREATKTALPTTQVVPETSICGEAWRIKIPEEVPVWLTTPAEAAGLHTEVKYTLLAGELIFHGMVEARDCADGGLTPDGAANTCGMETAYPEVVSWQNQFDEEILKAGVENQIPAQLIKRIFAQETQFWPPNNLAPSTYGIGNVTSPGIEPLFMWYDGIYQDTCRAVFSTSCGVSYHALPLKDQQLLRGYLISQYLHAYCPTCPYGLDVDKIKASIDYFAKLIVANCHQVDLILNNHGYATSTLSYEDAWRVTIANYTIGAGCVINAIGQMDTGRDFSWEYFREKLSPDCQVDIYVNRITGE